ncbi:MAG: SHOCT domain-containing protein [Microbacteriaceae bacterium]|jgi:putative membrane protein
MMYGYGDGTWGMGAWIIMAVFGLLFWAAVITAIVLLVRRTGTGHGVAPAHHDAERILNERFARGEIDEEEFSARRSALRRL